jgi:hypothetical protein
MEHATRLTVIEAMQKNIWCFDWVSSMFFLIKEFVNSNILDCPAMLVEKRDSNDRRYGQINWNTKLIGFVIYQFNIEDPTSGLLLQANSIAYENREYLNCKHQEENTTNLTTQQQ